MRRKTKSIPFGFARRLRIAGIEVVPLTAPRTADDGGRAGTRAHEKRKKESTKAYAQRSKEDGGINEHEKLMKQKIEL
ncbi:uncharacterized protein SPSK_10086 [Sporothrix schenckii 1099-18]|uniref:Uncharacterized protein n=1 Tax=Sporothrix schenckii 1099-18 TaxID=1397361 RepID=A0A0F2MBA0_SPOSC|nr:uncharacterized protein SPSK_10086 [Sporothrix schenckii 1099-18]KJR85431.1 hypothetical protein SPSK_10086 [Sporothrix schenckii 1099-18]